MAKAKTFKIGDKFGSLTIISNDYEIKVFKNNTKRAIWKCQCDCGEIKYVTGTALRLNKSTRCNNCAWKDRAINKKQISQIEQLYNHRIIVRCRDSKKQINNDLTIDEFKDIIFKNCYYCGEPPTVVPTFNVRKYINVDEIKINGIDRIDSNIGYNVNNCVPCCIKCNTAKSNLHQNEFIELVNKIYKNLNKDVNS